MNNIDQFKRLLKKKQYIVLDSPYIVAISRGTIRIIWTTSAPRRLLLQDVRELLKLTKTLGNQPTVTVEAWRPKRRGGWRKEALL